MRTTGRCLRVWLIAMAGLAVGASPVLAQDGDREWKVPHKNGHTFSPIGGVPHAFVRSYLRSSLGIANSYDVDIPLGIVDGDTLFASRGGLLFANLQLEYQQTIRDWIAIRAGFRVLGRLGTGTAALLTSGVSATSSFELGWLIRLLETDKSYLSLDLAVTNTNFTTIDISRFVEDIIDGEDAELTRKTPSMRAGPGLSFTHAFSPLIGIVLNAETGYGESVDRESDDEWFFRFGGTIDFDLGAVGWLPIGLAAGYVQDSFPEGGADITDATRAFLFRIGYVGREDLALGLDINYTTFPTQRTDTDIKNLGVNFDIRYYF